MTEGQKVVLKQLAVNIAFVFGGGMIIIGIGEISHGRNNNDKEKEKWGWLAVGGGAILAGIPTVIIAKSIWDET